MLIEEFCQNPKLIWQFINDCFGDYEWINLYHEHKDKVCSYDDIFVEMYEFDDYNDNLKPIDLAFKIFFGDGFNPNDDYFSYDAYENLYSCSLYTAVNKAQEYLEWYIDEDSEWFYEKLIENGYTDTEILEWLEEQDVT